MGSNLSAGIVKVKGENTARCTISRKDLEQGPGIVSQHLVGRAGVGVLVPGPQQLEDGNSTESGWGDAVANGDFLKGRRALVATNKQRTERVSDLL